MYVHAAHTLARIHRRRQPVARVNNAIALSMYILHVMSCIIQCLYNTDTESQMDTLGTEIELSSYILHFINEKNAVAPRWVSL